jgi:hypothetical protein
VELVQGTFQPDGQLTLGFGIVTGTENATFEDTKLSKAGHVE